MSQNYACMNYGGCANAGIQQPGPPGVAPVCPGCGNLMTAQGRAKRRSGVGDVAKVMGLVLLGLIALVVAWKIITWGYYRTAGYDIIGRWRAEQTSVMGVNFPIGVNIEFARDSATVLDTKVPVAEYERERNKVHVFLQPDQHAQVNLTFVLEDNDHMTFDGPLGVTLRYRRIKGAP